MLTPTDARTAASLIRRTFRAIEVPLDPPPSALRVTAADVLAGLAQGGGAAWDDQGLRGCVLWHPKHGGLYLGRLAVAPEWQGRGIARALIAAAEAAARHGGLDRLLLEVRLPLTGNRRLFATCGFIETALRCHPGHTSPTFTEAEKRLR